MWHRGGRGGRGSEKLGAQNGGADEQFSVWKNNSLFFSLVGRMFRVFFLLPPYPFLGFSDFLFIFSFVCFFCVTLFLVIYPSRRRRDMVRIWLKTVLWGGGSRVRIKDEVSRFTFIDLSAIRLKAIINVVLSPLSFLLLSVVSQGFPLCLFVWCENLLLSPASILFDYMLFSRYVFVSFLFFSPTSVYLSCLVFLSLLCGTFRVALCNVCCLVFRMRYSVERNAVGALCKYQ